MSAAQATATELARRARDENPVWYHTLELAPGVVTSGHIDLRGVAPKLLPADLGGKRALDVGTFDGFWAFELERRGAETVAIDVPSLDAAEWPPLKRPALVEQMREWDIELGRGFRIAAEALGSRVRRVETSVYELEPELIGGPVSFAFSGSILLHLRDPVRGLERILGALEPGGTLALLEPVSLRDSLRSPRRPLAHFQPLETPFNWWFPNLATLRAWLAAAGFTGIRRTGMHRPRATRDMTAWYVGMEARRPGGSSAGIPARP